MAQRLRTFSIERLEWCFIDEEFDPDFCDNEEIDELMQEWTERLQQPKQ